MFREVQKYLFTGLRIIKNTHLSVVGRGSETQLQVSENLNKIT